MMCGRLYLSACFVLLFVNSALSQKSSEEHSNIFFGEDLCQGFCDKLYVEEANQLGACSTGCRYYTLTGFQSNDEETTKKSCKSSCENAYTLKMESDACEKGCTNQAENNKSPMVNIEDNGIQVLSHISIFELMLGLLASNMESILKERKESMSSEDDVPMMPSIIITRIRTLKDPNMLPSINADSRMQDYPSDWQSDPYMAPSDMSWYECILQRSGLPKSLLFGSLLLSICMIMWFCFASSTLAGNKSSSQKGAPPAQLESSGAEVKSLQFYYEQYPSKLVTLPDDQAGPLPAKVHSPIL